MKRKIWTFILLMVCVFGIWIIFETAPTYVKGNFGRQEIEMTQKEVEEMQKVIKKSPELERGEVGAMVDAIAYLPRYKALDKIIFRSLPIIAFGVGIYLLFLRKGKQRKVGE